MGWEELANGRLLAEAAATFEAFLTVDKNIKFEHNLESLPVAVVVLVALKNTPEVLIPYAPFVESILPSLRKGQMIEIAGDGKVTVIAPGRDA